MDDGALQDQIRPLIEQGFPFVERMGLRMEEVRPGYCRLTAPIEGNGNHIGTMYAGALFTLAEIPGGALFLGTFDPSRYYPVVKGMAIRFLKPARTDITVEATIAAEEVERIQAVAAEHGKADYALSCELVDADGVVVATSQGDYQLRAHGT
jgi:thioesterase domain-containing protein